MPDKKNESIPVNQDLQAQLDAGGVENVRQDGSIIMPVKRGSLKKSQLHEILDQLASKYPEGLWEEQTTETGIKGYRFFTHCYARNMKTGNFTKRKTTDEFGQPQDQPREVWVTNAQSNEAILSYARKFFDNPV